MVLLPMPISLPVRAERAKRVLPVSWLKLSIALNPVDGEPCNTCQQCREITAGNSFNVIEIDAASNRGIDSIRDLREKVMMPPSTGKYKVYVLDEAHMLDHRGL